MSSFFRDIIIMGMGMNLVLFAGGLLLSEGQLAILSLINMSMLGFGLTLRDSLEDKDDE